MRFVPVKPTEMQAEAMDLSARDLLVRQRTQLVNALRGHAAEFGIIAAKGIAQVEPLLRKIAQSDMPQAAKETLVFGPGGVVTLLWPGRERRRHGRQSSRQRPDDAAGPSRAASVAKGGRHLGQPPRPEPRQRRRMADPDHSR